MSQLHKKKKSTKDISVLPFFRHFCSLGVEMPGVWHSGIQDKERKTHFVDTVPGKNLTYSIVRVNEGLLYLANARIFRLVALLRVQTAVNVSHLTNQSVL